MDILRFIIAGNVDDGKSTLTGRLLLDTGNIKSDILDALGGSENEPANLAHVSDGLRAERQGGITIDVAYKYFTIPGRKFILTDAPGHFQYTRNLVTGASCADAMVLLVDAQQGVKIQTLRHLLVASFLRIPQLAVVINKMDLAGYHPSVFETIKQEVAFLCAQMGIGEVTYIPVSARAGGNVSIQADAMPWYQGATLLEFLAGCMPAAAVDDGALRLNTQHTAGGFRFGNVVSGVLYEGDVLQTNCGKRAVVTEVYDRGQRVAAAGVGANVSLVMSADTSMKRGDLFFREPGTLYTGNELRGEICWLDDAPLVTGKPYHLRICSQLVVCKVTQIVSVRNLDTLAEQEGAGQVRVNEFAKVVIATKAPISFTAFSACRETGRGILVDPATNNTSGAFIVVL